LIGIHCCGNTDWSMIMEAGPDIISFDAFDYMDYLLLYRDDIVLFIKQGGIVAWGIIPTASFTGKESVESLSTKLDEGFRRIYQWGIGPEMLAERSILTPACGMGTMSPEAATRVLDLLSLLSHDFRNPFATHS
ncbi:MAG TPA: methionine synthase, partial [Acidobacteriota bacterium]|nr:methionine synthase [Acidobacteriota bacterium]